MIKKICLLLAVCFIAASCAKQEIQGEKQNFVGNWDEVITDPDQDSEIEFTASGTGHYLMVKPGSRVEFKGNVYFKNASEFTIGGKMIKKKFKINKYPAKVVESLKPYKFHYEATFNGIEYKRTE